MNKYVKTIFIQTSQDEYKLLLGFTITRGGQSGGHWLSDTVESRQTTARIMLAKVSNEIDKKNVIQQGLMG